MRQVAIVCAALTGSERSRLDNSTLLLSCPGSAIDVCHRQMSVLVILSNQSMKLDTRRGQCLLLKHHECSAKVTKSTQYDVLICPDDRRAGRPIFPRSLVMLLYDISLQRSSS